MEKIATDIYHPTMKILSIIVPSYNMEAYLPKCLGSLVIDDRELFEKLDVIVVNDGSKDRTSGIAHEFEAKYPGVFRVIDKVNGQYGSCINAALKIATGTFVKILDADDWFDTEEFGRFLWRICQLEKEHPSRYDLIISLFDTVDPDGNIIRKNRWPYDNQCELKFSDLKSQFGKIYLYHVAYRLKNLKAIEYRQTEGIYYTDMEWITIPMSTVGNVYFTPFVVYKYLVGREGQSVNPKMRQAHASAYVKILMNCAEQYSRHGIEWGESSREYVKVQLMQMAALAYSFPVYYSQIKDARKSILGIRENLMHIDSDLAREMDSCIVLFGKTLRISVVSMCLVIGFSLGLSFARMYKRVSDLRNRSHV